MKSDLTHGTTETAVQHRYAGAAQAPEAALCCPVQYDQKYLAIIPPEVIEKDYGCGDPSRYLREGETVLDLGSGTGKICFIASQVVGPTGKVIGVDMTDEMLEVARRNAPIVAERIGFANVEFRKGRIQDLALNLELLDRELKSRVMIRRRRTPGPASLPAGGPAASLADADTMGGPAASLANADAGLKAEELAAELRVKHPLVASESVDVVVSNCVLNLVAPAAKQQLFAEIHRVLKRGGRAVISDIVSDEEAPAAMQNDPELWSGCISGALREDLFLKAFEDAGFYGITLLKRDAQPWRTVEGIEFRSVTVEAFKGKQGACFERNQAVIYKGPFRETLDDDGHRYRRGERVAVCDKTFNLLRKAPYAGHFEFIEPLVPVPLAEAPPFDCARTALRAPRETKGQAYRATSTGATSCCDGGNGCC